MKVALFLNPDLQIESGGSYIFENEILKSLSLYTSHSAHTFYVFSGENYFENVERMPHIHFVHKKYNFSKNSKLFRVAKKIYSYLSNIDEGYRFKKRARPIYNYLMQKESKTLKELVDHNIDVVWFLGLHCPTMELPFIVTVWDLGHRTNPYFPEVSNKGGWDQRELLCSKVIQRAAYVITGTRVGKADVERYYQVPPERVRVLPFVVPSFIENFDVDTSRHVLEKYNIPDKYLFYPAQFWPLKNHVCLLKAVQFLRKKFSLSFDVILTGSDQGNRKYIEQLVSDLGLTQSVYFLGFVPQSDMAALYQHAFALTYATFLGPDNLPPLEALALGCPVIASKVSGAQEQLGDAAIFFDPKQPEDLALSIKSLHDDRNLKMDLIQKGKEKIAQWTREDYVKEMLAVLDDFSAIRECWSNKELYEDI
jgi:glycosyltransferase involved in cell wall biosynthesis